MTQPESDLLQRLAQGDLDAFDALVEHFERRLQRFFFLLGHDAQLAEDCTQEVFVRLFKARERYTPDAAATTFVFRIARNLWIDVVRSRRVRPGSFSLDQSTEEDEEPLVARVESAAPRPEDVLERGEDEERLRAAIRKLPDGQQAVLALAANQSLRYEDVAAILDIPVGTVKSRVHAAVQTLRRLLGVVPAGGEAGGRRVEQEESGTADPAAPEEDVP